MLSRTHALRQCVPLPSTPDTRKKPQERELGVEDEKSASLLSRLFVFRKVVRVTLVCGTHDTPPGDWVFLQDVTYPHALSFFSPPLLLLHWLSPGPFHTSEWLALACGHVFFLLLFSLTALPTPFPLSSLSTHSLHFLPSVSFDIRERSTFFMFHAR